MSFETEQKLRMMMKWLAYSEVDFGDMDPTHRDEYLHDGIKMAVDVVKSLYSDTLQLRNRTDPSGPIVLAPLDPFRRAS